ncbi:nuclear transport factor 2 family protein [Ruegeria sp. 2205SS24-7]|uniref:nuclear transport factor 2 family protein n=1 Tax=Ruegeria discodermiae TaxID=3064389 RepID=UPI00274207AF|nr:nuclear transport factor 2 family protein [Ruegeria sp. 2205SS24-7]MDP5216328.1 nuclear transport factor 2 family protein [Ruegeria sp. 2205SS24-7]
MTALNETLARYGAAWRESDPDRRLAHLAACFAETGRYVDPSADVTGRGALSDHIGQVLAEFGGRVELTSAPQHHHGTVHFKWHMVAGDGSVMIAGRDFARLDAKGQIAELVGFFGEPEALG